MQRTASCLLLSQICMARSAICNCKGPVSCFDLGMISRFLDVRVCTKFLDRAQRKCSNRQARQQAARPHVIRYGCTTLVLVA